MPKNQKSNNQLQQIVAMLRRMPISSKPKQRQQRRPRRKPQNLAPNTTAKSQKMLQRPPKVLKGRTMAHPYMACRLAPFTHSGTFVGIPDGNNSRRVVVDHSATVDISFLGSMAIRILPTLPFGLAICPSVGTNFNITDQSNTTGPQVQGSISPQIRTWIPCGIFQEYASIVGQEVNLPNSFAGVAKPNPYGAAKVRIVGVAWRMYYTGTVTAAAGTLVIKDAPIDADMTMENVILNGVYYQTNSFNTTQGGLGQAMYAFNMDPMTVSTGTFGAYVGRIETNPWGVLKHNKPIYEFGTYKEQPMVPIENTYTAGQASTASLLQVGGSFTSFINGKFSGVNFIDDSFSSCEILLPMTAGNQSVRIEVKTCVEYLVPPGGVLYPLTKPAPSENKNIMKVVEDAVAKMPPAVTDMSR